MYNFFDQSFAKKILSQIFELFFEDNENFFLIFLNLIKLAKNNFLVIYPLLELSEILFKSPELDDKEKINIFDQVLSLTNSSDLLEQKLISKEKLFNSLPLHLR